MAGKEKNVSFDTALGLMRRMGFLEASGPAGTADATGATRLAKAGDRLIPVPISAHVDSFDGEPALDLVLDVLDEVPQCRELRFTSVDDGRGVRTADLSAIRLNELVDDVCARFAIKIDPNGIGYRREGDPAFSFETAAIFQRNRRGVGKRKITPSLIRDAAEVYKHHFEDGPIGKVATAFNVSPRTASGWITKARELGYLSKTTRGKKAK
jgi:hypothetical protein